MRGEALWLLPLVLFLGLYPLLCLLAYRYQPNAKTIASQLSLSLVLVIVCLSRLASMGIVFALEYAIFEPLLALIFGNTEGMKRRGGYFYNFKLGEMYRAAQTY